MIQASDHREAGEPGPGRLLAWQPGSEGLSTQPGNLAASLTSGPGQSWAQAAPSPSQDESPLQPNVSQDLRGPTPL